MRRSNAPSVLMNSAKRSKLQPPVRNADPDSSMMATEEVTDIAGKFGLSLSQSPVSASDESCEKVFKGETLITSVDEKENLGEGFAQQHELQRQQKPPLKIRSSFVSPLSRSIKPRKQSMTSVGNYSSDVPYHSKNEVSVSKSASSPQKVPQLDDESNDERCEVGQDEKLVVAQKPKKLKLSTSTKFTCPSSSSTPKTQAKEEEKEICEVYYSVVWGKASNKKHKKWEGDGVLIVAGKHVTLKDMEAKQIGKGSGYKSADIHEMCDGSTLMVGGKEIEVQGRISKEDYLSGKCFLGDVQPSVSGVSTLQRLPPAKPFIPLKHGAAAKGETPAAMPRHDPTKPGALVMPRPTKSCQWKAGKDEVVDVVVDPFLSQHLRPHQREGVTFLYECVMGMRPTQGNGAILADEMGLGKTLQCISLIWTLLKQSAYGGAPCVRKVVVITPGSLVKNWCQEFTKWLGSERLIPFPVSGDNRVDEFLLQNKSPVMVISYEMFLRCIDDVRKAKFNLVICDEAHRLKNAKIKTGTALGSLGIAKIVLLTGTPIQNNLEEFYTLAEVANPGIFGSLSVFKKVFVETITRSQQPDCDGEEKELGNTRAAELTRMMSMFVLRRTAEINKKYLPPKVEHVVFIKMSDLQLKLYTHLLKTSAVRSCLSYSYNGSKHLVCINAMRKVCNDPKLIYRMCSDPRKCDADDDEPLISSQTLALFPDDYSEQWFEHSAKLSVLEKMLSSFLSEKQKCIVVSNSTKTLDILEDFLKTRAYSSVRLDGQTPMSSRQSIVNNFNNRRSNSFIFLLSSKAGGVGLNLTGASKLILYDLDWNPANDLQSMARVWRDGQKHSEVRIYRFLITNSIEEKIYQRQVSKQALSGAVVDFTDAEMVEFSRDDLKDLFTLKETDTCTTHDMLQCDCVEQQLGASDVSVKNIHGSSGSSGSKNASMAELMDWEHLWDLRNCVGLNDGLRNCDNVTFMFRSKLTAGESCIV